MPNTPERRRIPECPRWMDNKKLEQILNITEGLMVSPGFLKDKAIYQALKAFGANDIESRQAKPYIDFMLRIRKQKAQAQKEALDENMRDAQDARARLRNEVLGKDAIRHERQLGLTGEEE